MAPRFITAGESVLAYGHLSCASAGGEAGQTVTLYQRSVGSPGYAVAGAASTDTHGFFQIPVASVQTNSDFYAVAGGDKSARRPVKVAAQVTLSGPAEGAQILAGRLKTGRRNAVTFTGTVSPADTGATVVLQRQNAIKGNEWHRIDRSLVGADGSFSITHVFIAPGDANIRVLVRGSRRNIPSPSNVLTYEISQAQNPQLTILSSTNPIPYGGSTTISGTVAGAAAGTPVTLLAHVAKGKFAPVAQSTTDASGNYAFASQMPLTSMFYKVQGAGKFSTTLYEGVKDMLTASVSTTTVEAGQNVTFSGAVTPDKTGHIIYLERQNASGSGFHVVQVATIGAGSTYSIARTVFAIGTSAYRVKIPGDPQNGGAASELFTITATPPSSAAKLPTTEPPNNSSKPAVGQV